MLAGVDIDHKADHVLSELAAEEGPLYAPTGRMRKSSQATVTRADVIRAFQHTFEMIGGVPRLALWADQNPSEFYKIYGRLLPASSTTELDGPQELLIQHALPPPQPYIRDPGRVEKDITPGVERDD